MREYFLETIFQTCVQNVIIWQTIISFSTSYGRVFDRREHNRTLKMFKEVMNLKYYKEKESVTSLYAWSILTPDEFPFCGLEFENEKLVYVKLKF